MIKYIRFTFKNVEPLKIADDSTSENEQVNTLGYVPGSSIRGSVINAFVKAGEFDEYKQQLLFDGVSFLNAYIIEGEKELIPSLKGFYEDKTDTKGEKKHIENILINSEISSEFKRANLGKYCYPDEDCIHYTGIRTGSDMKINKRESNVLRNQYIEPGYRFAAYIAVSDDDAGNLSLKIKEMIERMREDDSFVLGGSRSFGYGKCNIDDEVNVTAQLPYGEYAVTEDAAGPVYMVLLSDMAMINDWGETVGIDPAILAKKLGAADLSIDTCATSVVDVRGYNRTWRTWVPSSKMYEKGSVFKLDLHGGEITNEALRKVMDEGIGIRTNEGYGRVIFLKNFDKLTNKKEITKDKKPENQLIDIARLTLDEMQTLRIAAKGYYMNCIDRAENEYLSSKGPQKKIADYNMESSQLGNIEAILYKNLYSENGGFEEILTYLRHAGEKDNDQRVYNKDRLHRGDVAEYIVWLRDTALSDIFPGLPENVMGIKAEELLTPKELNRIKQELVISEIQLKNRKGGNNE